MKKSDAVRHFGNQRRLARALGVTDGAVSQWGEELPGDRQAYIELITGGALKADIPDRRKYKRPAVKAQA